MSPAWRLSHISHADQHHILKLEPTDGDIIDGSRLTGTFDWLPLISGATRRVRLMLD